MKETNQLNSTSKSNEVPNSNVNSSNMSPSLEQGTSSKSFRSNHPFLEQLSQKSAMCLVNEVCRWHKLRPLYTLINTVGPEHAKSFSGI